MLQNLYDCIPLLKKKHIKLHTKTTEHNVTHNYILFKIVHFEHHLFEVVQDISDPWVKDFFPQLFPAAKKKEKKKRTHRFIFNFNICNWEM